MNNSEIAKIFKALCDEHRIAIIQLLQDGEQCACEIASALGLSKSKLSYHMKILCESKIIHCWHQGKWTHYALHEEGRTLAIEVLKSLTKTKES